MLYRLALKFRHLLYDKGIFKVHRSPVPTIGIGNITVGGTGKTPHVEMALRMLLGSERWGLSGIAVLSRGYGRQSKGFQQVLPDSGVALAGDEPLQMKRKFPGVTVAVDKDRVEGCRYLADPEGFGKSSASAGCWNPVFPRADIIVLDDCFQYRALKPTLNILLVSYDRPLAKDSLLPFGRLRDLRERQSAADLIIVTKCPPALTEEQMRAFEVEEGIPYGMKVMFTTIDYETPVPLSGGQDSSFLDAKKAVLFSGIADDAPLKRSLSGRYDIVRKFSFPDHHAFTWADIQKLQRAARKWPRAVLVTTEKDAQRLRDFPGLPEDLARRVLVQPIRARFVREQDRKEFEKMIFGL